MDWNPRITRQNPPEERQRVFYYFEPSGRWFCGEWSAEDEVFHGRFGFCDKYDAPYWHPEPPNPTAGMGSQEFLPDCMMPDGAEPCKGYLQLQEAAIQFAQEKQKMERRFRRLFGVLDALHDRLSECGNHPISAAEAYDSDYRGMVSDALSEFRGDFDARAYLLNYQQLPVKARVKDAE